VTKYLAIISLLFLSACSTVVFQERFDGGAQVLLEVFNESPDCNGKGMDFKGLQKQFGSVIEFRGNEVFLEAGTYYIYYTYKEQVDLGPNEQLAARCATKGLLIDSMKGRIESSSGKAPSIKAWPRFKITVEPGKSYYIKIQNGQPRVEHS